MTTFIDKTAEFISKKKFKIIFYSCLFALYLFIGMKFISHLYTSHIMDYVFGTDSLRVFLDWTSFHGNHYRVCVHPLYILLIFPFTGTLGKFTKFLFGHANIAIVIITTIISVINVFLFDILLKNISKNKSGIFEILRFLIVLIFAFSFSQLENLAVVETYTFCLFSLLLFFVYMSKIKNKELKLKQYIILSLLGVLCASFLITNIFVYFIGLAFIIILNKKKSVKQFFIDCAKYLSVIISSVLILAILCKLQEKLYPNCVNSIEYSFNTLKGFFTNTTTTDELAFVTTFEPSAFINIIKFFFGFGIVGGMLYENIGLHFNMNAFSYICISLTIILLIYSIVILIKNKNFDFLPYICIFVFDCILHTIYGNSELLIYTLQIIPIIFIIIAMGLTTQDETKNFKLINKILSTILLLFFVFELILNIFTLFKLKDFILTKFDSSYVNIITPYFFVLMAVAIVVILTIQFVVIFQNKKRIKDGKIEK